MDIKIGRDEDFARVVRWHGEHYPLMQPADWGKLTYQSCFGPEHLLGAADEQWVYERLAAEWREVAEGEEAWRSEPLAGGLRRLRLPAAGAFDEQVCRLLARLFCRTGAEFAPAAPAVVAERLALLGDIPGVPEMKDWLAAWEQAGRPAPSHSETFRQAYHPHYRLLRWDWAIFFGALAAVAKLLAAGKPCVVLIDGRCGGGKTSLAVVLKDIFAARVVHIDDYYLPVAERRPDWQRIPGANLDKVRFQREVLQPLAAGGAIRSRAYDCRHGVLGRPRVLAPAPLTVIEGSYSLLMAQGASAPVGLRIYVDCNPEEQERRLRAREGEYFPAFERIWLPLEERYFAQYGVRKRCDLAVVTE